ncbi:MAG TPA: sodium-dependent transporter [Gemmatimonadota bacterium]|nr:sodium-dependent transporter [Gemmatimonadota bacterium]
MPQAEREQWSTRLGFVLAAVGSAVGLGNMWRFPYLTAENGGAAFLLLYILTTVFIGLPIMLAEFTLGRGAKRSPIQALASFGGRRWRPLGFLFVLTGFLILAYYGVIAGWTFRYAAESVVRGFAGDPAARFQAASGGWDAVLWQVLFMGATITIVAAGVRRGIERTSLVLMPALAIIVIGLDVYAATLPGAGAGYAFYLKTSFSDILSWRVLADAAGQAFFSLSLGMGAMLTFASYLSRDEDLPQEAVVIAGSNFAFAFVAGLMVFPIIFAFGLSGEVGESAVGALFISLPRAFASIGPAGRVVGLLFFLAMLVAALTSALSLLEVVAASAIDGLGWTRRTATLVCGGLITLLGVPAAFDLDVLDLMDKLAGNVLLLVGGLFLAVFVGWVAPDPIGELRKGASRTGWLPAWRGFLRWVVPALLLVVLYFSGRDAWGSLTTFLAHLTGS